MYIYIYILHIFRTRQWDRWIPQDRKLVSHKYNSGMRSMYVCVCVYTHRHTDTRIHTHIILIYQHVHDNSREQIATYRALKYLFFFVALVISAPKEGVSGWGLTV